MLLFNDISFALAPEPGTEKNIVKCEYQVLAWLRSGRLKFAETAEDVRFLNELNHADALLLSHGRILAERSLKNDPFRLIRKITHEEIEAILQIAAREDRPRYSALINLILSREDIRRTYLKLKGAEALGLPDDLKANDIIATAFELYLAEYNGLAPAGSFSAEEGAFLAAARPVIDANKHAYFTGVYCDPFLREAKIRFAIAGGMIFTQVRSSGTAGAEYPDASIVGKERAQSLAMEVPDSAALQIVSWDERDTAPFTPEERRVFESDRSRLTDIRDFKLSRQEIRSVKQTLYDRSSGTIRLRLIIEGTDSRKYFIELNGADTNSMERLKQMMPVLPELQTPDAVFQVSMGNQGDLEGNFNVTGDEDGTWRYYGASDEQWQGRRYRAFVENKDGARSLGTIRLVGDPETNRIDHVMFAPIDGSAWERPLDPRSVRFAMAAYALVWGETPVSRLLQEQYVKSSDLRHVFRFPYINGKIVFHKQLASSERKLKDAFNLRAADLDLVDSDGRPLDAAVVKREFREKFGYTMKERIGDVAAPGDFFISGGAIRIIFHTARYPLNGIAVGKGGRAAFVAVKGASGKLGADYWRMSEWLEKRLGWRPLAFFVLDNGADPSWIDIKGNMRVLKGRDNVNAAMVVMPKVEMVEGGEYISEPDAASSGKDDPGISAADDESGELDLDDLERVTKKAVRKFSGVYSDFENITRESDDPLEIQYAAEEVKAARDESAVIMERGGIELYDAAPDLADSLEQISSELGGLLADLQERLKEMAAGRRQTIAAEMERYETIMKASQGRMNMEARVAWVGCIAKINNALEQLAVLDPALSEECAKKWDALKKRCGPVDTIPVRRIEITMPPSGGLPQEAAFAGSLKSLEEVSQQQFGRKALSLSSGSALSDRKGQCLILYADDMLQNALVVDLENTVKNIFAKRNILTGGRILIYSRNAAYGAVLEKILRRADPKMEIVTVGEENLPADGDAVKETDSLVRIARSKGAKDVLGIIRGPVQAPEALAEFAAKSGLPVVVAGPEKGVYSFAQAITMAIDAKVHNGATNGWLIMLPPLRTLTADMQKQYERYLASLQALVAA